MLLLSEGRGDNQQYTHSKTKEQEAYYLEPSIISCVDMSSVAQLCLTLFDSMDYSPPGSSAHGIFQARILEWVAISYSRGQTVYESRGSGPGWQRTREKG